MISIDIKKAFDTINWDFTNEMLNGLGFPVKMINRIMACISSPKFSISLNDSLHGYFKGQRGLRQCDPLSPYLFILEMKYLSRNLDMLKEDRSFRYHPRCCELKITHLIFADNFLLFSNEDLHSVRRLFNCFKDFSVVAGLEANPEKCKIFYGGVDEVFKSTVNNYLCFSVGALPIKYLGVPMICRLQIIKSVILGIQIYWTSNYLLSVKVLQKIDEMCRNFLWGKSEQILKVRDKALGLYGGADSMKLLIQSCYRNSKIQISALYNALSPASSSVSWHNIVWETINNPRYPFVCWLAIQNRLLTQDKLINWGIVNNNCCCLCMGTESKDHIFFEFAFSRDI
ncbi:uncharacterized protein LOC109847747 [Asparagus officinalis]|uniref:uncharacterized protein LOC109847747 n=1 Tax=Asparagus officinalis TaxID=4686 RepID=UPI00098DE32F|nr:uncharacterized protein LOC109847747 [Asparagus officinalis]